jgi:amino acid transporter
MMHYILIALASLVFVFLKSWQQRNVAFNCYKWIVPTSFAMALIEVYVVAAIAMNGFGLKLVLAMGTGASLGCLAATFLHTKYISIKDARTFSSRRKT